MTDNSYITIKLLQFYLNVSVNSLDINFYQFNVY